MGIYSIYCVPYRSNCFCFSVFLSCFVAVGFFHFSFNFYFSDLASFVVFRNALPSWTELVQFSNESDESLEEERNNRKSGFGESNRVEIGAFEHGYIISNPNRKRILLHVLIF